MHSKTAGDLDFFAPDLFVGSLNIDVIKTSNGVYVTKLTENFQVFLRPTSRPINSFFTYSPFEN